MTVIAQYHSKFRVFTAPASDPTAAIAQIDKAVGDWASDRQIDPKSVGVEYLEGQKLLIVTVGYETAKKQGQGYRVQLQHISLGKQFPPGATADTVRTAKAMEDAAEGILGVICHEFFVTDSGEMILVLMSHVA